GTGSGGFATRGTGQAKVPRYHATTVDPAYRPTRPPIPSMGPKGTAVLRPTRVPVRAMIAAPTTTPTTSATSMAGPTALPRIRPRVRPTTDRLASTTPTNRSAVAASTSGYRIAMGA